MRPFPLAHEINHILYERRPFGITVSRLFRGLRAVSSSVPKTHIKQIDHESMYISHIGHMLSYLGDVTDLQHTAIGFRIPRVPHSSLVSDARPTMQRVRASQIWKSLQIAGQTRVPKFPAMLERS